MTRKRLKFMRWSLLAFVWTLATSPFFVILVDERTRWYCLCGDCECRLLYRIVKAVLVLSYPFACTGVSVLLLCLACKTFERIKLVGLPLLFFSLLGIGVMCDKEVIVIAGAIGLSFSPNWLGEILRVKASQLGCTQSAIGFMIYHIASVVLAFLCYKAVSSREPELGLFLAWWLGTLVCYGWFYLESRNSLESKPDEVGPVLNL